MRPSAIQFYETEYGNRMLIREGLEVAHVRDIAQTVVDSAETNNILGKIKYALSSYLLERSVIVTMGDYEDDEFSYTPPSGENLAKLLLTHTIELS